jgi:hypothetical protein
LRIVSIIKHEEPLLFLISKPSDSSFGSGPCARVTSQAFQRRSKHLLAARSHEEYLVEAINKMRVSRVLLKSIDAPISSLLQKFERDLGLTRTAKTIQGTPTLLSQLNGCHCV